jgi:protein-tyrosine phosphatase
LTELNWDERIRTVAGQRTDNSAQSRWSTFKQTDGEERGFMDRYLNIRPWNHNRVKLQVPEGQFDYVNASTVTLESPSDGSRPPLRYIAMQGPTEPSIPYVWRMIAEQVEPPIVIVQLTSMVEAGLLKCNQYFPDGEEATPWTLNEQNIWGDDWNATLTYDSMEPIADGAIEKRKLLLHVEGEEEPRVVWHFLYKRWPDFGVPVLDDLDSFFELMRISREHSSPKGPRVVHCSAGIGRTGTFISLEHLIRELDVGALYDPPPSDKSKSQRNQKQDLIYDTVDSLRQQRRGMVQGETQYRFIYQVLRKLWQDRYGAPVAEGDTDMVDGGVELSRNGTATDPFLEKKSGRNATNDEDSTKGSRKVDDTDEDEDEDESHGNDVAEDEEDEDGGAAVPRPNASATRG